jgi:hypothetical protein
MSSTVTDTDVRFLPKGDVRTPVLLRCIVALVLPVAFFRFAITAPQNPWIFETRAQSLRFCCGL